MRLISLALIAAPLAALGASQPLVLEKPIACALGSECFIQQYFDHDPGPGAKDYRCGSRAYDQHDGVDIRLPTLASQRGGVAVLAAAPGTVRNMRDGEEDQLPGADGRVVTVGRECGNGVVIAHPGGWETQYCHMAKNSVRVRPGDRVDTGTPLGQVGLSGDTEFPHLHFSVRRDSQDIDPFSAEIGSQGCGAGRSLWSKAAAEELAYRGAEIINMGFAAAPVSMQDVEEGSIAAPNSTDGAFILYARAIGLEAGDVLRLTIVKPDGTPLVSDETPLDRGKAQYYAFAGRKRPPEGWPPGRYVGKCEVVRDGKVAAERSMSMML